MDKTTVSFITSDISCHKSSVFKCLSQTKVTVKLTPESFETKQSTTDWSSRGTHDREQRVAGNTLADFTQYKNTLDLLVPKGARVNGLQHYLPESSMVTQINVSKSSVIQGLLLDEILRSHVKRRLSRSGHPWWISRKQTSVSTDMNLTGGLHEAAMQPLCVLQ